jgi:hypothetical protein
LQEEFANMPEQQKTADLPRPLAKLGAALKEFQPPSGPFDPKGAWEHRYAIWVIYPDAPGGGNRLANQSMTRVMGALRIRRQPEAGAIMLDVGLAAKLGGRVAGNCLVTAHVTCADDPLATPRAWDLRSVTLGQDGKPIEGTESKETGQIADGMIRRRGKAERAIPAPKAFTSSWSLFDALQRLPGDDVAPMTFDLLEEMDLLKPNQRLYYRQTVEAPMGGRPVRLHGFEQIGEGILPYTYWLDDQRRLLIAVGGMRAYLFDASAELPEVTK